MSVPNNTPSHESALAVTLTVGELRALVREEIQAVHQNGQTPELLSAETASSRLLKNSIFPNQNYYRYDTILHTF